MKLTWIVQPSPAASVVPQLFVSAKSPLLNPPTVIDNKSSAVVPVLVNCNACALPEAPIVRLPKFTLVVDNAGACTEEEFETPF